MTPLAGKVAVITGAGRGLGRAHALDLARHGADVVLNDVNVTAAGAVSEEESPLAEVVREVERFGRTAVISTSSVASPEGAAEIAATARDAFGRVDVVVNNAGFLRDRTLAKMTDAEWQSVIDVHLGGSFYVARAFWPELRESAGAIIFTTSHAGLLGQFGQANYAAAKSGIVGLSKTLALEGARHGVRVNTIAPIATTRLSGLANEGLRGAVAGFDPAYVARLVTALVTSNITGGVFGVADGRFSQFVLHETESVRTDEVPAAEELAGLLATLPDRATERAVMPS